MGDSLEPQISKLVKVAEDVRRHAGMITSRHPELESRVVASLGNGFTRVKAAAMLPSVAGNGKKPADADVD